jgi:aspartyl protease family protein
MAAFAGDGAVSTFGKLALVASLSAFATASVMAALSTPPLRAARLAAAGFASEPRRAPSGAVSKGADGHFWAWAQVNGEPVRFLVDTGATAVALTPADAERLGFRPRDLKFNQDVTTAAGASRAARVTLASVSIGGARLEDVEALVVDGGLDVSLLGMSYLGRLTRFEGTRDRLSLQP